MVVAATQQVIRICVVLFLTIMLFIGMVLVDSTVGIVIGKWMARGSMLFVAFTLAKIICNKIINDGQTGGLTLTRLFSLIK